MCDHDVISVRGLRGGHLPSRVARKTGSPSFRELLRPEVIKAFGNALAETQRRNAILSVQTGRDNTDILFGPVMFAGLAFDVPDQLLICVFLSSGFLCHLGLPIGSMNSNPSATQIPKSTRWVLKSDSQNWKILRRSSRRKISLSRCKARCASRLIQP